MIDLQAVKYAETWAENALRSLDKVETIEALDLWILGNRYHLADVERAAPKAWDKLRSRLHARDQEIRERIRQGVG